MFKFICSEGSREGGLSWLSVSWVSVGIVIVVSRMGVTSHLGFGEGY